MTRATAADLRTPPRLEMEAECGPTPAARRAKMAEMQKQIDTFMRERSFNSRKHTSEVTQLQSSVLEKDKSLREAQNLLAKTQRELERCKAEGEGMREELNMYAVLAQQKALLVLAQEQLQVVELESRLVQAEQQRVMRDHKIALFQAREQDLLDAAEERVARIEELERLMPQAALAASDDALRQYQSSSSKKAASDASRLSDDNAALESKVEKLEASVVLWKSKEKEAQAQLESWLRDEKGKAGSSEKEMRGLKVQLRATKADLENKSTECSDLQEEMDALKARNREREKELKAKLRAVTEEKDKLEDEDDIRPPTKKSKASSPVKAAVSKGKKQPAPESDSEPEPAPKKTKTKSSPPPKATKRKARRESDASADESSRSPPPKKAPKASSKITAPLAESSEANKAAKAKLGLPDKEKRKVSPGPAKTTSMPHIAVTAEDDGLAMAAGGGEKKKKRKLFGTQAAFEWDPVLQSGSGVIPTTLSPIVSRAMTSLAIPRAGLAPSASMRSLSRF